VVSEIPAIECEALLALYDSTNGTGWITQTNWLTNDTPCNWYGVGCTNGHVTGIDLNTNNLDGLISIELGNLDNLRILVLSRNHLTGDIPIELSNLASLELLFLDANQLSGIIAADD